MSDETTSSEATQIESRSVAHPLAVGALIAGVLLAGFAALAAARQAYATSLFDSTVVRLLHGVQSPLLTRWAILGTQLGSFPIAGTVAAVFVVVLLFRRMWTAAALVVIVYGVGYYWGATAQALVRRVRPPQANALIPVPNAFSFPSGHSITAMLLYGAIAFLVWRTAESRLVRVATVAVCTVLIVLVGFTRAYLGVHWPSDVVGAWLLGGAWLALIAGAYIEWEKHLANER